MNNAKKTQIPLKHIVSAVSFFIALTVAVYIAKWGVGFYDSVEKWGQLGDFFGGLLNPVIGFAGVLLLALTLKQNQDAMRDTGEILKHDQLRQSMIAVLQAFKSDLTLKTSYSFNIGDSVFNGSSAAQLCCIYYKLLADKKEQNCDRVYPYLQDALSTTAFTSLYALNKLLDEELDERRKLLLITLIVSYVPVQVIAILYMLIRKNEINSDADHPINKDGVVLTREFIKHCEMDSVLLKCEAEAHRIALKELKEHSVAQPS
ncbi:hypothetical protein HRH59_10700 [Rheinheimera sp. YQF-2]|uniref:Uncharacterized protein n=1 Tax=Rheinheimera lutimaris TaxID=2740584 RepID=A0A7Y5EJ48_9GAMM|nr:hypothetical protein [Rheinheimera lutimaris]NRQ43021.1 hypothetical protein [Rheinheimera lutimaris]